MFENFITIDVLLSFAGMIVAVCMLTQFTKSMFDNIVENRTKWVAYGWTFALCFLAAALQGQFDSISLILQTIAVWLVNSVIVWFASMKAYEEIEELHINIAAEKE